MCGIAGILNMDSHRLTPDVGTRMLAVLKHRGPDDGGWTALSGNMIRIGHKQAPDASAEVLLLHRRLSILDLSAAGRQPMSSEDGRYHIVFNGEIYNYVELRSELARTGWCFLTGTDTEVLLAAWSHWGEGCLCRLVGMFAFAVLDTTARTVTLVRDFFGIKPLFYTQAYNSFAFASEIKALLQLPEVHRKANHRAVYKYLVQGANDHTPETAFDGIYQLPPAHLLQICLDRNDKLRVERYWDLKSDDTLDISFDEAKERLQEMFLESVALHLRSDVPVGTALSGGIDSSSIAMAVRRLNGQAADFHTFSFIASGSELDEERWVDVVVAAARSKAHKVRISPKEIAADLDGVIAAQDEPFTTTSICAQYRVFRLAQEAGIKVLLDGQGADELFAGYLGHTLSRLGMLLRGGNLFRAAAYSRAASISLCMPPHKLLVRASRAAARDAALNTADNVFGPVLTNRTKSAVLRLLGCQQQLVWLDEAAFKRNGLGYNARTAPRPQNNLRTQLVDELTKASLPALLRFEDRNSMAFGIESRVPFLTPQLVQFVLRLPDHFILSDDAVTKHVFRAAMRGIVPDSILDRRDKIGFSTPERQWLSQIPDWVKSTLRSDAAHAIPYFRHNRMIDEANSMLAGRRPFDGILWRSLNLIRWAQVYNVQFD